MGAWIEIDLRVYCDWSSVASHPLWVRGLKYLRNALLKGNMQSHPLWVRGLKSCLRSKRSRVSLVAPFVGAWIEIVRSM